MAEIHEMTMNEYQNLALETAIYPQPIIYPALGLTGEAGEVADKVKKVLRDNDSQFTPEKKLEIAKEIGDVLWYCATLSHDLGYTLENIASMNYAKLRSRQVRNKLHEVARFFNKHKEDVAPEVYKEFLKLLYRRAKKVVEVTDILPQDDAKAAMTMLQEAIKEDNTYFEAINSDIHSRNIALNEEVEEKTRKVDELTEESEQKSQHIGSLKTKNEGLTADKEQLTIDLHERENELRMEREHKKEEQKARLIAEKKNELYEKKEELEKQLENLRDEIYPWKEKRLQSFKNKEIFMTILPIIVLMVVLSFIQLIWKEEYRSFEDSSYSFWTIALLFLIALICSTSYSTEKRREARREKAYKAWEAKHENAEYGRLQEKIKEVKDEITTCKNLLEHSDEWM